MKMVRCKMHYDIKGKDNLFLVPRLDSFINFQEWGKALWLDPKLLLSNILCVELILHMWDC